MNPYQSSSLQNLKSFWTCMFRVRLVGQGGNTTNVREFFFFLIIERKKCWAHDWLLYLLSFLWHIIFWAGCTVCITYGIHLKIGSSIDWGAYVKGQPSDSWYDITYIGTECQNPTLYQNIKVHRTTGQQILLVS